MEIREIFTLKKSSEVIQKAPLIYHKKLRDWIALALRTKTKIYWDFFSSPLHSKWKTFSEESGGRSEVENLVDDENVTDTALNFSREEKRFLDSLSTELNSCLFTLPPNLFRSSFKMSLLLLP